MASHEEALAAIRSRLMALRPVDLPVGWPNEVKPATTDSSGNPIPWAYAEVAWTSSTIVGVGVPGDQVWVDDGLIIATVYMPDGEGDSIPTRIAKEIGSGFRVKQFYDAEPGVCIRSWAPRLGDGGRGSDNGMWFAVSVTIPFEFWYRA